MRRCLVMQEGAFSFLSWHICINAKVLRRENRHEPDAIASMLAIWFTTKEHKKVGTNFELSLDGANVRYRTGLTGDHKLKELWPTTSSIRYVSFYVINWLV